ncbi:MAG: hypothetical protein DDT35_01480 [Firmicutes bacterium]|nr:hypothetical protein [Bacillota bacterium]
METALALSQVENSTEKAALATAIFGRAGTKLLPVLAGGKDGLFAFFEEAERLGVVMSKEDVKSATLFGDAMTRLKLTLKGVAVKVGGAVAPILTELGNKLAEIAGKVSKFVQANKPLILTVFKVGVALAAAGVAITAIGLGIVFLGATLSGLAVIAGAVVVAFKATVAAIVLAFKAILAAIVFLISPIGLVIAAVVALGAYLLYASGAGQRGLDSLRAAFASIKETAIAAFGGIKDALSAGDWKLAVEILWAAIKLEWEKGTGWLYDHWLGFKDRVLMIWEDLTGKLRDTFSGFINTFGEGIGWLYDRWLVFKDGVLTIWEDLTGNLREIFSGFIDTSSEDWGGWMAWFGEAWTGVQKRIAKGFAWIIGTVKGLDTAAMMEDIDRQYKHRLDEQRNTRKLVAEEDKRAREARAEARKRDTKARQTELKGELDAAIARARKAAEAKAPGKAPGVKDEDDRAARLARIRASIRASIPSATLEPPLGSIAGTFSAAVAMRLGDERTVQERIAEAAEEAVEGIDHLIDVAEGLGLEW